LIRSYWEYIKENEENFIPILDYWPKLKDNIRIFMDRRDDDEHEYNIFLRDAIYHLIKDKKIKINDGEQFVVRRKGSNYPNIYFYDEDDKQFIINSIDFCCNPTILKIYSKPPKIVFTETDPYGEEDWNESYSLKESVEQIQFKDFSKYIGKKMTREIKDEIEENEKQLLANVVGHKVTFKNDAYYKRGMVTDVPQKLEIKIDYKPFPDWTERLQMGKPLNTDIIERITLFIYTLYEIYTCKSGDYIEIHKGEQRIDETDPYGEEEWGDESESFLNENKKEDVIYMKDLYKKHKKIRRFFRKDK